MRTRQTYAALLLCVAVSCSSFASGKVRQSASVIEEMAKQTEILVENDRLSVEQAQAISSALKVALAEVERYWESVKADSPRATQRIILDALADALAEATRLMAQREQK
jgi:hypothetical protein